jgi:peptide/nickel transport system permease protein
MTQELLGSPRRSGTYLRVRRVGLRLIGVVAVLFVAATLVFLAQHLMPGNPGKIILGGSIPNAHEIAVVDRQYGFDNSLVVQYLTFIGHLAQGNLGTSWVTHQPVSTMIGQEMWPTLELTVSALVLAWVISLALTLSTTKRGRFVTAISSGFEIITAGLPQFWLGILLLVIFAIDLKWFPVEGGSGLRALFLPALTLAVPLAGFLGQVTRDEFARTLDEPFVISARARGMSDGGVRVRHVLRHAVLPGITLSGWALGSLFSSAVIVEAVFTRQGLGQVLVSSVSGRDMPVVVGITLLIAVVYVVANLLVDVAYVIIDPRMKAS